MLAEPGIELATSYTLRTDFHGPGVKLRPSYYKNFFVAIVEDNATMSSIWKLCIVFCAKPKEVNPIKHISVRQISV